MKEQTDLPLLVREDDGHFLRQADVKAGEHGDDTHEVAGLRIGPRQVGLPGRRGEPCQPALVEVELHAPGRRCACLLEAGGDADHAVAGSQLTDPHPVAGRPVVDRQPVLAELAAGAVVGDGAQLVDGAVRPEVDLGHERRRAVLADRLTVELEGYPGDLGVADQDANLRRAGDPLVEGGQQAQHRRRRLGGAPGPEIPFGEGGGCLCRRRLDEVCVDRPPAAVEGGRRDDPVDLLGHLEQDPQQGRRSGRRRRQPLAQAQHFGVALERGQDDGQLEPAAGGHGGGQQQIEGGRDEVRARGLAGAQPDDRGELERPGGEGVTLDVVQRLGGEVAGDGRRAGKCRRRQDRDELQRRSPPHAPAWWSARLSACRSAAMT